MSSSDSARCSLSSASGLLRPPLLLSLLALLAGALGPSPVAGQIERSWNSPRVLELVAQGRQARAELRGDPSLESYSAEAEGHIYFFVDPLEGERALIRVDQVALEMYWKAPNLTKQVIVGMRDEKRLPVRDFHYFVDRLTVVQNNFGDIIQVGEGSDVAGAPHPIAVGRGSVGADGEPVYDYRLADSISIRLPGQPEPVRLYRVEVRPRDPSIPAVVGSVYLDRSSGAIVRMDFTFTPSAYTDRRNDWIRISIDHGLWEGRHWLPNQQRIEVRRELPELDIGVGTVIRAVMRVSNYDLNVPLDVDFFAGRPVVARPTAVLERHPFREGLLERLSDEGLRGADRDLDPRQMRAEAARLMRGSIPTGLPPLRFHVPALSSALRFNRAEGLFLGGGVIYAPDAMLEVRGSAGYAMGAEQLSLLGEVHSRRWGSNGIRIAGYGNRLRDIGEWPGSAGVINSIAAATSGRDYLDPYFSDGGEVTLEQRGASGWRRSLGFSVDRHTSASLVQTSAPLRNGELFRPIRAIEEGTRVGTRLTLSRRGDALLRRSRRAEFRLEGGAWEGHAYGRALVDAGLTFRAPGYDQSLDLSARGGANLGERPPQHLFLLGGRQTLPGFGYRDFAGDRFLRIGADASMDIGNGRWLRLHAGTWAGWTGIDSGGLPAGWDVTTTEGIRVSAGAGVGIFYDILRLDLARGLNGGEWQVLFSVDPLWWDRL